MSKKVEPDYYSHSRYELLNFIPSGINNVLDIGCGKGNFGKLLKNKFNYNVWGIEPHQKSALEASLKLDKVFNIPFDSKALSSFNGLKFDCIFFNDVLEHLLDPAEAIKSCKILLKNEGYIVSSIPNILHFNTIFKILKEQDWKYDEAGIMDNTHLRFFSKKSILRMFEECNFDVQTIQGINPCDNNKLKLLNLLFFNYFENMKYTQYVTVARKNK